METSKLNSTVVRTGSRRRMKLDSSISLDGTGKASSQKPGAPSSPARHRAPLRSLRSAVDHLSIDDESTVKNMNGTTQLMPPSPAPLPAPSHHDGTVRASAADLEQLGASWAELEHSLSEMMESAERLWGLNEAKRGENDDGGASNTAANPSQSATGEDGANERRRRRRLQQLQRSIPPTGEHFPLRPPLDPPLRRQSHQEPRVGGNRHDYAYSYEHSPSSADTTTSSSLSASTPSPPSPPSPPAHAPSTRPLRPLVVPPSPVLPSSPSLSTPPHSIASGAGSQPADYERLLAMQPVSTMEWLRATALRRLSRLFRQYGTTGGKLPAAPPMTIEEQAGILHAAKLSASKGALPLLVSRQWTQRRVKALGHTIMKKVRLAKALSNSNLVYANGDEAANGDDIAPVSLRGHSLYGVPLSTIQSHSDCESPLPRFVHDMMDHLLVNAESAEGVFRRNGVKMRIHEIKERCGQLGVNDSLERDVVAQSQLHDLADALKQYFRDLPECLITDTVSTWLEHSARDFPTKEARLAALHYCIILLPDENREALLVLLKFLQQIAQQAQWNQMSEENLATCLMPSLFRMPNAIPLTKSSRRKTIGMPNEREREAYNAVKTVLAGMIRECDELAMVPQEMWREVRNSPLRDRLEVGLDLEMPLRNGLFDFRDEYHRLFQRQHQKLREDYLNGWRDWQLERVFPDGTQLFGLCAEIGSGRRRSSVASINNDSGLLPLRQFLLQINNIPAPVATVHSHLLHHRPKWERNVVDTRRIGTSGQNFDVVQVNYGSPIHSGLRRHAYLARRWHYGESGDELCTLIERSVVPKGVPPERLKPRLHFYKSAYVIACGPHMAGGQSQLSCLFCVDSRGKSAEWYERVGNEAMVEQMCRLREHFVRLHNSRLRTENGSLNPHHQRRETIV